MSLDAFFPFRLAVLESDQFLMALQKSAMPVAYTSFEFSFHHAAMLCIEGTGHVPDQ